MVCVTGQHRAMLDQVLETFGITPDFDLDVMQPAQTLTSLTSRLLALLEPVLAEVAPAMTVVQGDTTTTFSASLASFYAGVPVAHVEAGLRTFDMQAPFPEEMNRALTTPLSALHFAPTPWARTNLVAAGVRTERIAVTGNTGIDAVFTVRDALESGQLMSPLSLPDYGQKRLVVVTAHRRESHGEGLTRICQAIAELAKRDDVQVVWPVHPNPEVRQTVHSFLDGRPNVLLLEPLEYVPFVDLMRRAYLIITDSGGIQEEAPSLGKPVLLVREKTERPEGVQAGAVTVVGTDRDKIIAESALLLDDPGVYQRVARVRNPYGDGCASDRIAARIAAFLGG
jgi:UDP-N-acetylglucosamine 2-epimerase (non-hydrolysing)